MPPQGQPVFDGGFQLAWGANHYPHQSEDHKTAKTQGDQRLISALPFCG